MLNSVWAWLLIWGTLVSWVVIASLFTLDSIRVHGRSLREFRRVQGSKNGRLLVASRRKKISFWFLQGAIIGLAIGVVSLLINLSFDPGSVQSVLARAFSRVGIVYMFFCFWRAKRANLGLMTAAEKLYQDELTRKRNS